MREFPQEPTDKVVDHMEDNKALKICNLICKAWLPRSRYHLFSTVTLTAPNLASFVDLIDASSLSLLPFVRHLKLKYTGVPLDVAHLARLHHCPNLTSIGIEIGGYTASPTDWLDSDELLQTHIRSWSANATSLVRFDLKFGSLTPFPLRTMRNLLSCIPSVETLGIDVPIARDTDIYPSYAPARLAHLDINVLFEGNDYFFRWLLSLPVLPILKSLKYRGQLWSGSQLLKTLLQRAGGELESLTLHMFGTHEGASLCEDIAQ